MPQTAPRQLTLEDYPGAEAALLELCRPFAGEQFSPRCEVIQPDEIPFPQDQLLVHHGHMTEVLQRHHDAAPTVHVQEERHAGDIYTRKIILRAGDSGIVELGIMRLDFRFMSAKVRDEILAKQTPLGAILIAHNVHRRIKPRWFLRLPADGPVVKLFGDTGQRQTLYGRIGTIYCDEQPAIQLLEIVVNTTA